MAAEELSSKCIVDYDRDSFSKGSFMKQSQRPYWKKTAHVERRQLISVSATKKANAYLQS